MTFPVTLEGFLYEYCVAAAMAVINPYLGAHKWLPVRVWQRQCSCDQSIIMWIEERGNIIEHAAHVDRSSAS